MTWWTTCFFFYFTKTQFSNFSDNSRRYVGACIEEELSIFFSTGLYLPALFPVDSGQFFPNVEAPFYLVKFLRASSAVCPLGNVHGAVVQCIYKASVTAYYCYVWQLAGSLFSYNNIEVAYYTRIVFIALCTFTRAHDSQYAVHSQREHYEQ